MKRISLFLLISCLTVSGFAQESERQTAEQFLKEGKLDKALEDINLRVSDQSESGVASVWITRGDIYLNISVSQNANYKALDPDPLQKALDSYKKAVVLDTKQEYKDDIFNKINWLRNAYYNLAVDNYNKQSYKEAMLAFASGASALGAISVPDTISWYYAAACAGMAGEKALARQYFTELLRQNARSITIYVTLADNYRLESDFENALRVVREGQSIYPDNMNLLLSEANIYLTSGEKQKALQNLETAIGKDPSNPTVFFALGTVYDLFSNDITKPEQERQESFSKAIDAYKSAIALNPDYFEANYNLGALYVNQAANFNDKANKQPVEAQQEFERLKAEADKYLEAAIPYLEKAAEVRPDDINTLSSLKQIYTRLNRAAELRVITGKINALQKK
jgi:tetratricopeptide (TPR) repeat protein